MSRSMKWIVGLTGTLSIVLALLMVGLVALRVTGRIANYSMPSNGMVPTLSPGDNLLADGSHIRPSDLRQGDVIVFHMIAIDGDPKYEGSVFIQRIAALPGQRVKFFPDRVEVDGKEFTTPSADGLIRYRGKKKATSELVVPQGHVLTLGDNASHSFDGRYWGCLPMDHIIQKAVRIYWPPERAGAIR